MNLKKLAVSLALGIAFITIGGWVVVHLPFIPYNIRELVNLERPLSALFLLSCFLYWTFGVPLAIAVQTKYPLDKIWKIWIFPLLIIIHSSIAWGLLRLAVPIESIQDIVGAPILAWPWEWESLGRFAALFSFLSLALTGACLMTLVLCRLSKVKLFLCWLLNTVVLFPLIHWIVVTRAATDNLTELMAGGGGVIPSLFLLVYLLILSLTGSLLAVQFAQNSWYLRCIGGVWFFLSFPLAYLALSRVLENSIVKYDQTFSAMQFLLSMDREHLAAGHELFRRYFIFHCGFIIVAALIQFPLWNWAFSLKNKTRATT